MPGPVKPSSPAFRPVPPSGGKAGQKSKVKSGSRDVELRDQDSLLNDSDSAADKSQQSVAERKIEYHQSPEARLRHSNSSDGYESDDGYESGDASETEYGTEIESLTSRSTSSLNSTDVTDDVDSDEDDDLTFQDALSEPYVEPRDSDAESDVFFDALTQLSVDDPPDTATTRTSHSELPKTETKAAAELGKQQPEKSSRTERLIATLLAWGLNKGRIRAKISTHSTRAIKAIKDRLKAYKEGLSTLTGDSAVTDRMRKEELKALQQAQKAAKASSKSEAVDYLKLVKALKQIYTGQKKYHEIKLESLSFGGGQYNLSDVELGVTQVELVESPNGNIHPKVTANIKGTLEIPLPGEKPLKVRLDMKDFQISLEGRLVPAANAWIGSYGIKKTLSQLQKIRHDSGSLFNLRHVGLQASSIAATLVDPSSGTLAAFIKRTGSTRGRAIDKVFVALGLPLDVKVDDLQIHVEKEGVQARRPLLAVKGLESHYKPPAVNRKEKNRENKALNPRENRELHVHADQIDVYAEDLSETVAHTVRTLATEEMLLLPGTQEERISSEAEKATQSTKLKAQVKQLNLTLGREVKTENDQVVLSGNDQLTLTADSVSVSNQGRSAMVLSGNTLQLSAEKNSESSKVSVSAKECDFSGQMNEKLSKKVNLNVAGDVKAGSIVIEGRFDKEDTEVAASVQQLEVSTQNQPARITTPTFQASIPADLKGKVDSLSVQTASIQGKKQSCLKTHKVDLQGHGALKLESENHQLTLPVNGQLSNQQAQLDWQGLPDGRHNQMTSELTVKTGKTHFENVQLDRVNIKSGVLDVDKQMNGTISLNQLEISGDQLLDPSLPVPDKFRSRLETVKPLLAGRKLHLSMSLPIQNGMLDISKIKVNDFGFDHETADNESWQGWFSKHLLNGAAYLTTENYCSVESMTISEGRLWVGARIYGFPYTIWLPTLNVPGYDREGTDQVHLPELLHSLSGAHFTELDIREKALLKKAQSGDMESLYELADYCDAVGAEKSCKLLKQLDITPWLASTRKAEADWTEQLLFLTELFSRYPETSGKALSISLLEHLPVSEENLQFFSNPSVRKHCNPIAIAELHAKLNKYTDACELLEKEAAKTPANAETAYALASMYERRFRQLPKQEITDDTAAEYQQLITKQLALAANNGHAVAMVELRSRAKRGQPLAKIALAGILFKKNKTPAGFYNAIAELEPAASLHPETMSHQLAMSVLQRRARNAGKMFIHAEESSDQVLASDQQKIGTEEEEQFSNKKLYLWGLRYLYGVENIQQDQATAIRLLRMAKERGVKGADIHLTVAHRLTETTL